MTRSTDRLPKTTADQPRAAIGSDVIGDALRAMRIRGTLLLREAHQPPFCVAVPPASALGAFLRLPTGSRAVAFHLAEKGSFELRPERGGSRTIEPGEMVLGVGGRAHHLARGSAATVVGLAELLAGAPDRLLGPAPALGNGQVRIICGALVFGDAHLNPLFTSLPEFLPIRAPVGDSGPRIGQLISILLSEIAREDAAANFVVERLLEVLCAEGIRTFAAEHGSEVGWFRGLADASIGRAIRAFHAAPTRRWHVARLAREAHLSPSRFAARFVEVTGDTVMGYVTRWRMNVAMRALSESDRTVSQLAVAQGYESPAAFSRAFKKHVGCSPTVYRKDNAQTSRTSAR